MCRPPAAGRPIHLTFGIGIRRRLKLNGCCGNWQHLAIGQGRNARQRSTGGSSFLKPNDQGPLQSSSAHACAALLEYFERRSHGQQLDPSVLFLYYTARRMLGAVGNVAVNLRATLKAIAHCGLPPQRYWPYEADKHDVVPDAFLYSFSNRYAKLRYFRVDHRSRDGHESLDLVRTYLAAGFPSVFGISMPTSVSKAAEIPYRPTFDGVLGGQSLLAVGYDDKWPSSSRGALLVRNSWSTDWGENGYGWLPYAFVEERLALDFWTVVRPDWIASGEFKCPL